MQIINYNYIINLPLSDFHYCLNACPDRYKFTLANWEAGKTFPEIIIFIGFLIVSQPPTTTTTTV